jgi:hypothetical protein
LRKWAAIGRARMPGSPAGHTLRPMHGMVSAGILIATFAVVAFAGLYVAIRIYLAGGPRRAAAAASGSGAAGTVAAGTMAAGTMAAGTMTERESS